MNYIEDLHRPLVSILINNYNYGRFLSEAIDSALNQTYSNIEIIVVDDGSTDNSHEIIKSYGSKIIPILKSNGGQASAFNAGFAASQGEIICFLDADDIFLPPKIDDIVNPFVKNEDIGWCFHTLSFFGTDYKKLEPDQDISLSGTYDLRSKVQIGKMGRIPNVKLNLATSCMCLKRSLLKQILPMPESIRITSDDYIKYIAMGLTPGFIIVKSLSLQRIHDNNAYTLRTDKNKQKLEAKIITLTAYWMKKNFPVIMSKFSNNMFAVGISLYLLSGGVEDEYKEIFKNYIVSLTLPDKFKVFARIFYNYIKFRHIKK